MGDLVPLDKQTPSELALIGQVRQMLAEAKTLPEFRHVMEAAGAFTDMAKRHAKLMEAQGMATEIVQAANRAANDAASVRIEAQAGAGRILREMTENGQRVGPHEGRVGRSSSKPQLDDLGVEKTAAHRWQRVADIPDEIRTRYVDEMVEQDDEITTAGLLRYANPKEPKERTSVEASYDDVVRLAGQILRYDAVTIASYASNTKRRSQFRKLIEQLREWADKTDPILT